MESRNHDAVLLAGIPAENPTLFLKIGLAAGDPAAWISTPEKSLILIRDIEKDRAQAHGKADQYASPAEYAPAEGLSSDRATATAQAVAEYLRVEGIKEICTDRSLPYIFAWHILQAGIALNYDADLGVLDRRIKSEEEQAALAHAQAITEKSMEMACNLIARCTAKADGTLYHDGAELTSERVKSEIAKFLLDFGFTLGHGAIVATVPNSADCHHSGVGPLVTGAPVIIDIFPRDESSRYWGDCTRTVVHGTPSDTAISMHKAVVEAKAAAIEQLTAGNLASEVHLEATDLLERHGFNQSRGFVSDAPTIQHGTGHGIGLEIHEPILLDEGGGELLEGEVFTVEPGLYGRRDGGVRIEDMLVVTKESPRNLNQLHEGLDWS